MPPSCLLGWRIGKGEGYADLEYAMMVSMGAVHEGTPVVTIVHDCQVRPADLLLASLPATLGVGARDTCSSSCLPLESIVDAGFLLGGPCCHLTVSSHPGQVVDIPEALLEDHDLTVDYILTPTRVITTGCARPKPTGIVWSKVGHPRGWCGVLWWLSWCSLCVLAAVH